MNDTQDLHKVRKLLSTLGNFYWTPTRPEYYVFRLASGQTLGLGKFAAEDYGLFNLIWAACPLTTAAEHEYAIGLFRELRPQMPVVAGQSLSDWLTQLSPVEFERWFTKHAEEIPMSFRLLCIKALYALAQVRTIRR